jgi:hypothetical protein
MCIYTHPPKFFHRAKNDSPFISVGSKKLLIVRGSLMVNFWGTLLYINVMIMLGASENKIYIRFHVLMAVGMKTCSGRTHCLHLHGRGVSQLSRWCCALCFLFASLPYFPNLKMEAVYSSKTLVNF